MPDTPNIAITTRTTRSNSQGGITLADIKQLIEKSKNETIKEMKLQSDKILTRMDNLEASNKRLQERNQELELEIAKMREEWQDGIAAMANEVYQRSRRRKNIVIAGVPECNTGSTEERKRADGEFCRKMFSDLSATTDFEEAIRIGRPSQDRPRLLKVRFKSMDGKIRVMRTSKELRNLGHYKNVFINSDRTRLEQSIDKKLRDELKTRKESGEDNLIIYKGKIVNRNDVKNFQARF